MLAPLISVVLYLRRKEMCNAEFGYPESTLKSLKFSDLWGSGLCSISQWSDFRLPHFPKASISALEQCIMEK